MDRCIDVYICACFHDCTMRVFWPTSGASGPRYNIIARRKMDSIESVALELGVLATITAVE